MLAIPIHTKNNSIKLNTNNNEKKRYKENKDNV